MKKKTFKNGHVCPDPKRIKKKITKQLAPQAYAPLTPNALFDDDDDVPPSKFEDEHDLRLNLRLSLRALGFCLLDPIVLI